MTIELDASPAVMGAAIDDHKLLCFAKSVGTPFAVYQMKADAKGSLVYQTASSTGWTGTLVAPNVFRAVNETVRVTVVHDGHDVSIYRNGSLVANASAFAPLDYAYAQNLLVGKRLDDEVWNGTLGNVLIRNGSWQPRASRLPAAELAALADLRDTRRQRLGLRAGHRRGGRRRAVDGRRPCAGGWFGVSCNSDGDARDEALPEHLLLGQRARLRAPRLDWRFLCARASVHFE